ncbi:MAG: hypothetical protein WA691_07605 [Thermoplasmata archaeon]
MTPTSVRSPHLPVYALLAAIAVTVSAFGVAAGASGQVAQGPSETGQGAFVAEHPLEYWAWHATQLGTVPQPVPAPVSVVAHTPTRLPRGGRSYTINAAVAGQTSVAWTFAEAATGPPGTELMVTFVDGLSGPVSTITVYVETTLRGLAGSVDFVFYWDAGTFAPGSLSIESMTATVQACAAIGDCP